MTSYILTYNLRVFHEYIDDKPGFLPGWYVGEEFGINDEKPRRYLYGPVPPDLIEALEAEVGEMARRRVEFAEQYVVEANRSRRELPDLDFPEIKFNSLNTFWRYSPYWPKPDSITPGIRL